MIFRFEPYHSMRKVDAVNDFEQIRKYIDGNYDHDLDKFHECYRQRTERNRSAWTQQ